MWKYYAIGNDHLGHGKTAVNDSELGYFGAEKSKTVVDDLHEITKFVKQEYGKICHIFYLDIVWDHLWQEDI